MGKSFRRGLGAVDLVGGGPGDPGLLTLKGRECLRKADVIVYDALISPLLLRYARRSAEKIFVGKRKHRHLYEQDQINALLLDRAQKGKRVCRLKGGDPFLFGRGGEESEFLTSHGIPCRVVPGVSSIIAVPAAAGIPLTHRKYASFVTIATGHEKDKEVEDGVLRSIDEDWCRYSPRKSLVILMGFARLENLVKKLARFGWPKKTPIALICSGTLPNQHTVTGTLTTIVKNVRNESSKISSPALIVVGEVVQLRRKQL